MIRPNVVIKFPGPWVNTTTTLHKPSGGLSSSTEIRNGLLKIHLRTSNGASRPKPKILTPLPYSANIQTSGGLHKFVYLLQNDATWRREQFGGGAALSALSGGFDLSPPFDWARLRSQAIDDLGEKVRGGLDLTVDIAQGHQTAKMLNLWGRLVDYSKTFTRKGGNLKGLISGVSAAHLEWIYGVKPLVSSIYGVTDELTRVVFSKLERFEGKATERHTVSTMTLNTIVGTISFPLKSQDFKGSVKYGVALTSQEWDTARWASLNPASLAWELLPYSFVVDWAFNVGSYIRNLETALLYGSRFRSGYRTQFFRGNCVGYNTADKFWEVFGRTADIQRTVLSAYPFPDLPRVDLKMGSSRILAAAALIGNALTRK